eukprot:TRINITY_DN5635_c0_g1_i1.p1 TRINITY_DN5635_c0_g1~~TRINITY_DN5635_c0_g1_i1.p1  ORF type:complete len:381 (+),score=72.36 TRINITY_DN5635_c0_g1_i1:67-1209(+)
MSFLSSFEAFDAFSRTDSSYTVRTKSGAIISILAVIIMVTLFVSEWYLFLRRDIRAELKVDSTIGAHLQVNLDIIFHHLPCAFISVNAMDKTGNYQLNIHHNVFTSRLDQDGKVLASEKEIIGEDKDTPNVSLDEKETCGDCYGAQTDAMPCCNTCEDVQEAYRNKGWAFLDAIKVTQCVKEGFMDKLKEQQNEGCRVHGALSVERTGGNVNIVPGKFIVQNSRYVVDSNVFNFAGTFNISHTILHLSFGEEYPGMKNPLNGVKKLWNDDKASPMYEYFAQVVPTTYIEDGRLIDTNQFSVTEYVEPIQHSDQGYTGRGVPGLFVVYDLSPIKINYKEKSVSLLHFITNLCAIIGGIFTVASLLEKFVTNSITTILRKIK